MELVKIPGDATTVTSITLSTKTVDAGINKTTGVAITAIWTWLDIKIANVATNNDLQLIWIYF